MSTELATTQPPSPDVLIQAFIQSQGGITSDNVQAFGQLLALKERMQAKDAEREFNTAMVELKRTMPAIHACKGVPDKLGNIKYKYAPLEEIDAILKPAALKYGFTYSFSEGDAPQGRVKKVCIVKHTGGHSEETAFTVRVGNGPPGSSEAQGDGAASTYAQRRALCDAFGIIVEADKDGSDDPRNIGRPITQEEADTLREMCDETKSNREKFLEYAGAEDFEQIASTRYNDLVAMLNRKRR